jgi:cyclopropane-fatty-acyl-phospholipid synthase
MNSASQLGANGTAAGRQWPSRAEHAAASTALDRYALARLQEVLNQVSVRVVLWDGTSLYGSPEPPVAIVTIHDRAMLFGVVRNRALMFGEGFSTGRLTVEGDLVQLLEAIYHTFRPASAGWLSRLSTWRPNTLTRSRDNIHHHYDLGNDFYRLWLDDRLQYTCAYFADPGMSLEDAQTAKMRHVCRKLALRPGERVVEAGCGWGTLALLMARECGVSVTAYNISHEQVVEARRMAHAEGLGGRVEFIEDDYRSIRGRYDVFVSIGMLEHVGLAQFSALRKVIDRALEPRRGRGLLHFIGRDFVYPLNPWIRKRIFPGSYTPTLTQVTSRILEPARFSVLDVENLRPHYARTLAYWLARFDRHADRIGSMFDETFARAWRLYLAGSQAAFSTGWLQLFQVTFARGQAGDVPWTRGLAPSFANCNPDAPVISMPAYDDTQPA